MPRLSRATTRRRWLKRHNILETACAKVFVADVITIESCLVDVEDDLDELRCLLRHTVDVELHQPVLGVVAPHVSHRQIYQEVVVGLSPLQVGLAASDVLHQFWCVTPNAVGRTHVDRGIELPTWPWIVLR